VYLPEHFREQRPELIEALIKAAPLAMLVTLEDGRPVVNHIPMALHGSEEPKVLRGHVARANPVPSKVLSGTEVLVVFTGPDHYVTPSWYPSKQVDGRVVPTWNYAVVHVRGRIRWMTDQETTHAIVSRLTDQHERSQEHPWAVSDAPPDYIDKMLRAIVGFEITVDSALGKFKGSQNRTEADRHGVARGLGRAGIPEETVVQLVKDPPVSPG
jgi:transcriptional regulator